MIEALRELDEYTVVDLLRLNSTQLTDAFLDEIEDDFERLIKYFNDEHQ